VARNRSNRNDLRGSRSAEITRLIDGSSMPGRAPRSRPVAGCAHCTAVLKDYREMSKRDGGRLGAHKARPELRQRIEAAYRNTGAGGADRRAGAVRAALRWARRFGDGRRPASSPSCCVTTMKRQRVRSGLGASRARAGGDISRRDLHGPAYGETMFNGKLDSRAGDRYDRAGLYQF